jgi:RNA polymerase sigma factor (sigma-70 family)
MCNMSSKEDFNESSFKIETQRPALLASMCRSFGKKIDRADIENAISEAIEARLKAIRNGIIESNENDLPYLRVAAKNALLKRLRRSEHERPMSEETTEFGILDPAAMSIEDKDMLRTILNGLPDNYREIIQMCHYEGYTIEQISQIKCRSIKSVYHLKEKAEKRMLEIGVKNGMTLSQKKGAARSKNKSMKK